MFNKVAYESHRRRGEARRGEAREEFENKRAMLKLLFNYFNRRHLLVTSHRGAYALHQSQSSVSLHNAHRRVVGCEGLCMIS